jgi:tetratricopeptide (TPR) repeat protein
MKHMRMVWGWVPVWGWVVSSVIAGAQTKTITLTRSDPYESEPMVIEHLDTMFRFASDGTGAKQITGVYLMQSEAAARQFGVLTIPFAAGNERVEIEYVRVRKPDGTLVETPASDAQEMPQEVTRQAPFYSDLKEKQVPVRNLRVGDRLEYKASVVRVKAEAPGEFWGQEDFGNGVVVLEESIELYLPKGKYVKVWSPDHAPVVTEQGEERVYRWTGSQLKPTVVSEKEKREKEKKASAEAANQDPVKELNREGELEPVAWTTFKSWEAVGGWYRGLEQGRMAADTAVKAKTAELIAGKATEEDKIRALYDFVSSQIRYIGVALGVGRYQPHEASEVLRNQYGDCKDKHTLLAAMLGAAGIHAEASLIGSGIRMNEEVPSPAAFNHMITALPIGDKTIWVDSTAEVAPYRMLLPTVRDKQTLVVPDVGRAELKRTPVDLPFAPFNSFKAVGKLTADGTIKAQMEYVTRGDDEIVMRALYAAVAPGQWDALTQNISRQLGFGGTTRHTEPVRPYATAEPARLAYDYEREKLGDWSNYRIVPLFPLVFLPGIDEKDPPQRPIELGEPRVETASTAMTLPAGWAAHLLPAVHEKTAFANFDKTYKFDAKTGTLMADRRIEIVERRLPAAQWRAYKKWLDRTISEGEPYIQLIRAEGSTAAAESTSSDGKEVPKSQELMREVYEQMQRGEMNKARETLDEVQKLNPEEPGLWRDYGYLEIQRKQWAEAIAALKKELSLHPEQPEVYQLLAQAQRGQGDMEGSLDSLTSLVKAKPDDEAAGKLLGGMLMAAGKYSDAAAVYKKLADGLPDDAGLKIREGEAEVDAGDVKEGIPLLVAALGEETDPGLLNQGAYALVKANIQLDVAVKAARQAVDTLSSESKEWMPGSFGSDRKARQTLLLAAWDTLGWALFKDGQTEEAETLVHAAWLNQPRPEVGLHLGHIEEKLGHREAALATYDMAISAPPPPQMKQVKSKQIEEVAGELKGRWDALHKAGVRPPAKDAQESLQALRTLKLGPRPGENLLVEYTFTISGGKIGVTHRDKQDRAFVSEEETLLRRAKLEGWTPVASSAQVVRKGVLNCHSGVCELMLAP